MSKYFGRKKCRVNKIIIAQFIRIRFELQIKSNVSYNFGAE